MEGLDNPAVKFFQFRRFLFIENFSVPFKVYCGVHASDAAVKFVLKCGKLPVENFFNFIGNDFFLTVQPGLNQSKFAFQAQKQTVCFICSVFFAAHGQKIPHFNIFAFHQPDMIQFQHQHGQFHAQFFNFLPENFKIRKQNDFFCSLRGMLCMIVPCGVFRSAVGYHILLYKGFRRC